MYRAVVVRHKHGIDSFRAGDVYRMHFNRETWGLVVETYESSYSFVMVSRIDVDQAMNGM